MEEVTVMLAFVGGLLAFISPCCLPLYPSFLSYITGVSVSELKETKVDLIVKRYCYIQFCFRSVFLSYIMSLVFQ